MASEDVPEPDHEVADEVFEEYATHFSVAVSPQEVMLYLGKMETSMNSDGAVQPSEIEYHSKIQMSHEAARQLRDLLDHNIGEGPETLE